MDLLNRLRHRRHTLALSALILALTLAGAGLHHHASLQARSTQLDALGQTLARSAAQQAAEATLSQDRLSQQAALQALTHHPQVAGATLHDVENHLLAQSGYAPGENTDRFRRYSAPVTLADNIAGHLQIALRPPQAGEAERRFMLIWALLGAVAAALPWLPGLYPAGARPVEPRTESPREEPAEPNHTVEAPARLRLQLEITNLQQLHERLNRDSFDRQLTQMERQLRGILSLYSGDWVAQSGQSLLVDFRGESQSDCAFRALCGAQLLAELSHLNPGPKLRLRANIHALPRNREEPALARHSQYPQDEHSEPPRRGIGLDPELIDEELQRHLELDPATGELVGVKAPYRQLLDKQQTQLQRLTEA